MSDDDGQLPVPFLDRLSTKITIAAIVFLFVLAAAVAFQVESGFRRNQYGAYTSSQGALEEQLKETNLQSAAQQARLLEMHLYSSASTVQAAAHFIEVQLGYIPANRLDQPLVEEFFRKLREQNQELSALFFLNSQGEIIQVSDGGSPSIGRDEIETGHQAFPNVPGSTSPSVVWLAASAEQKEHAPVWIQAPVYANGHLAGSVVATLPAAHLAQHLDQLQTVPGGVSFLVDPKNGVVAAGAGATGSADLIQQALGQVSVKEQTARNIALDGKPYYLVSVPLDRPAWQLVLVSPLEVIEQQSKKAANTVWASAEQSIRSTLGMVFVFFLCGLLATLLILDQLFTRRIAPLVKGVRAIAAGNLNVSVPEGGEDELGLLGRSFNQMAGVLQRRQGELLQVNAELQRSEALYRSLSQDLESRVEENTREIKQLYEQAAARSQELELLYRADEQLYRHLHLGEVLQALADVVVDQLEADMTSVMVWDEIRQRLVIRGSRGFSPSTIDRLNSYQLGDGVAGRVFQTGQIQVVEDVTTAPPPANQIALEEGIRSILSVPISIDERIFGVFGMNYRQARRFTPADIRLCQSLAQRAAIAIENARLYEQVERAATLEERQRLARELHDAITQSLYSLVLLAEAGRRYAGVGNLEQVEHHLGRLGETAQQALKEMRLLVYELRPLALAQVGLAGAIRQRLEAVEKRAGIQARLVGDGNVDLPPEVEEQLYRITVEALNNALKHARARTVMVFLRRQPSLFEIEVRDDGQGFDPQDAGGGIGLSSMHERATRLNSRLWIDSAPGQGSSVRVQVSFPGPLAAILSPQEVTE